MAGAERVVLGGTAALAALGVVGLTVAVFVDTRAPEHGSRLVASLRALGVTAEPVAMAGRADPRAVMALRALALKADVLHTHGYKALAYGLLARRRGTALVASDHGETAVDARVRGYEQLQRWLYRRVDAILAVSSPAVAALARAGVSQSRLHLVPNFVPPDLGPLTARTPWTDARPLHVATLGRLSPEKGLGVLLDAVAASALPLRVTLFGDGVERATLAARVASDPRLAPVVHLPGFASDVAAALADVDVLAQPSLREGMPLAVLEAVALGVPVLASRVGALPDLVTEDDNGVLVPPGDAAALGAGLTRLAQSHAHFTRGAVATAQRLRTERSADHWAHTVVTLYEAVTRRREARAA